jgi:hypothetical protein
MFYCPETEGARKLSPGFTLGKAKYTFRPEGARNADEVRFEGSGADFSPYLLSSKRTPA